MKQSYTSVFAVRPPGGASRLGQVKRALWSRFFVLAALLVAVIVPAFGLAMMRSSSETYLASERYRLEQALVRATNQIRLSFVEAELVAGIIEGFLSVADGIPERQIENEVNDLLKHNPSVLAVALAPDLVVTQSFPTSRNQKTLGLKYWQVPAQMVGIARAYRQARSVVIGPVPLVQGGQGYILRYPVFLPRDGSTADHFWGVISVVVKADGILTAQTAAFDDGDELAFALREARPGSDVAGSAFNRKIGPDGNPVVVEFPMSGAVWRASAAPLKGWPTISPQGPAILAVSLFLTLVIIAALLVLNRVSQAKEKAHALLLESIAFMNEGFVAFDESGNLVTANQRFLEYYPLIRDKIVAGISFRSLMAMGAERQQFPDAVGREDEWLSERIGRFQQPAGSFTEKTAENQWLKVTETKTPYGYTVGIRTDVTAEKNALDAAEAADLQKTHFISNVSHELRTPLTVIVGRATFLQHQDRLPLVKRLDELVRSSPAMSDEVIVAISEYKASVADQAGKVVEASKHMLRLVEDLLDWTTVERGTMQLQKEVVSIGELTDAIAEELRPQAQAKGLELQYTRPRQIDVLADKTRLRQILYNLMSNAIKFTDSGRVSFAVRETDGEVEFSVADTGCGIPTADLDRIFDRFQQVDDSATRKKGGFGLGLSIAKQLAVLHGGNLTVSSEMNAGSCFQLHLPRTELNPAALRSA